MTFTYDLNEGGVLIIRADEKDRANLRELRDEAESERDHGQRVAFRDIESEALERLIANSELEWIDPAETGDLTDAPMLGIRGECTAAGEAIVARWAYMDYQVRSFVDDLIETGKATFIS